MLMVASRRLTIWARIGALGLAAAAACTLAVTAITQPHANETLERRVSALEALDTARSRLRAEYPDGQVNIVGASPGSNDLAFDGLAASWEVWVWSRQTNGGIDLAFRADASKVRGPTARAGRGPRELPFVAESMDGPLAPLLDSPRALELAEDAGGREARVIKGVHLEALDLLGLSDGRLAWQATYAGTSDAPTIFIDARSGDLCGIDTAAQTALRANAPVTCGDRRLSTMSVTRD